MTHSRARVTHESRNVRDAWTRGVTDRHLHRHHHMPRPRARERSKRPSAAARVRGREEIETMNDARGDTALAQLYRVRARVIACVIEHAISFRRRRRHRHRTP